MSELDNLKANLHSWCSSIENVFKQELKILLDSLDHSKCCKCEHCEFNLCSNFQKYIRILNSNPARFERGTDQNFRKCLKAFKNLLVVHACYICKDKECNLRMCFENKMFKDNEIYRDNYLASENYDPSKDENNNDRLGHLSDLMRISVEHY